MKLSILRVTDAQLLGVVRSHCEAHHYLHRWPDPRSLPFAYVLTVDDNFLTRDGELFGLTVYKKPQHHRQRGLFGYPGLPTSWQVLDLARVWINPELQRPGVNAFSQLVALCERRLNRDWLTHHPPRYPDQPYHLRLLLSYADLRYHRGTAYQASNFKLHATANGKALYVRQLPAPRWTWQPSMTRAQLPLFTGLPIRYEKK